MAGAADLDEETLARFKADFPNAETFTSAEAIAESPNIDALFVSTPTQHHTGHVLAAIANGKHVVSEKPIATNLDDADKMIEAADKAGVTFMVGHSFGYETPIKAIRTLVASGELGPLRMLHNWYYTDWMYRPRNPEELDTSLGGGVTFRQGSHQFDVIRLIGGGLVRSVRAMTGKFDLLAACRGRAHHLPGVRGRGGRNGRVQRLRPLPHRRARLQRRRGRTAVQRVVLRGGARHATAGR